jgi:DNA-binding transcriptional regulator YiaG
MFLCELQQDFVAKSLKNDCFYTASEPEESITAEDIAALRKEMKLTQTNFGELLGVSAREASEWEHGKRVPDESSQIKLRDLQKKIANN